MNLSGAVPAGEGSEIINLMTFEKRPEHGQAPVIGCQAQHDLCRFQERQGQDETEVAPHPEEGTDRERLHGFLRLSQDVQFVPGGRNPVLLEQAVQRIEMRWSTILMHDIHLILHHLSSI